MTALTKWWIDLAYFLGAAPARMVLQERHLHCGVERAVPGDVWNTGISLTPAQLGYQPNSTKLAQLTRVYFNEEGLQAARNKLIQRLQSGRPQTSVGSPLIAGNKKSESQGHCLQSVVLSYYSSNQRMSPYVLQLGSRAQMTIDFFYRSTEVLQKFAADLVFLSQQLVPYLIQGIDAELTWVVFHFCNIYFSPLFLPVLYNFVNPKDFLEYVRENNPIFFYRCLFRTKNMLENTDSDHYNFRTRRQMHQLFLRHIQEGRIDAESLINYISRVEKEQEGRKKDAYLH